MQRTQATADTSINGYFESLRWREEYEEFLSRQNESSRDIEVLNKKLDIIETALVARIQELEQKIEVIEKYYMKDFTYIK